MSTKGDLPLITKYQCATEYNKITDCIKANQDKINKCDVIYFNAARNSITR
jgi:hypothetical protein